MVMRRCVLRMDSVDFVGRRGGIPAPITTVRRQRAADADQFVPLRRIETAPPRRNPSIAPVAVAARSRIGCCRDQRAGPRFPVVMTVRIDAQKPGWSWTRSRRTSGEVR